MAVLPSVVAGGARRWQHQVHLPHAAAVAPRRPRRKDLVHLAHTVPARGRPRPWSSVADCTVSPWSYQVLLAHHHRGCLNGRCSPALSDYAAAADTLGGSAPCLPGEQQGTCWPRRRRRRPQSRT